MWRRDRRTRREDKFAAETAQARLVLGTVVLATGSRQSGLQSVNYQVANNSPSAIYDVIVNVYGGGEATGVEDDYVASVNGGETVPKTLKFRWPPAWPFGDTRGKVRSSHFEPVTFTVVLLFTDSAGARWVRRDHGEPERFVHARDMRLQFKPLLADYFRLTNLASRMRGRRERVRVSAWYWIERRVRRRQPDPNAGFDDKKSQPRPKADTDNQEAAASE